MTPVLKSMLMVSEPDLDIITAIRYAQDEYTKFKNRYASTAATHGEVLFFRLSSHAAARTGAPPACLVTLGRATVAVIPLAMISIPTRPKMA